MNENRARCFLVYALAPEGVSARQANEQLNQYIGDRERGLIVSHDHFIGRHGGFQAHFTLRNYGGISIDELEAAEQPEKRFWWRRHRQG